jgi:hypothetical protein
MPRLADLFTDPDTPDHDAAAAALTWQRGLTFLRAGDAGRAST